jgi:UDP-N-acetylmuramoyl-L-alanyl-D-glutamate--2,6-diaminopimelate ligase
MMAMITTATSSIERGMSLARLLDGIVAVPRDVGIADLTLDSRTAARGGLFMACRGIKSHGLDYLGKALAAGVNAVLWEPTPGISAPRPPPGVVMLSVPELRAHIGKIADRFFGAPSAALTVAGVTGTNGKTTTAYLIAQALERDGAAAAFAGTIGFGRFDRLKTVTHTTPDCVSVHRQLDELRRSGARFVGMEVSSHALDQQRVDGVRFHTAVFTNLTQDHLDYHGTLAAYGAAKARLFEWPSLKACVVNIDNTFGRELAGRLAGRCPLTVYSLRSIDHSLAGVRRIEAREVRMLASGVELMLDVSDSGHVSDSGSSPGTVRSALLGTFNAENLLAALAVLLGWGIPFSRAARALEQCVAPPGRLETFTASGRALVVVDYAHTPDALEKALQTLRHHCRGRLWCVFGCGGDRDAGKRPIMGAVAAAWADEIILTDDNPRTEDPQEIVEAIARGIPPSRAKRDKPDKPVRVIRERGRAIATALNEATAQDLVLIAGKGHEDYQIYGSVAQPFSDRAEVRRLLGVAP